MNSLAKRSKAKSRLLCSIVIMNMFFVILCLGFTGYHTQIHCIIEDIGDLDIEECPQEYIEACRLAPGFEVDLMINSVSDSRIVCPWRQRTNALAFTSLIISFVLLVIFLFKPSENSRNSLINFLGLSFFAVGGLLTTFILMLIDMSDGRQASEYYMETEIARLENKSSGFQVSIQQGSYAANATFIFLAFFLLTSLTVYKLIGFFHLRYKNIDNPQYQPERPPSRQEQKIVLSDEDMAKERAAQRALD